MQCINKYYAVLQQAKLKLVGKNLIKFANKYIYVYLLTFIFCSHTEDIPYYGVGSNLLNQSKPKSPMHQVTNFCQLPPLPSRLAVLK